MEQLSQYQRRRDLIKSLLLIKDAKGGIQKQYNTTLQKQQDSFMLEAQIKQFQYQQIQNYPNTQLDEKIFCRFNPHKKAYFLCCNQYCDKNAIMCQEQTCKCNIDHQKCVFTLFKPFFSQIASKKQQPIPRQIELYFQAKSVIYEHMANRISQERQALMDWQQNTDNDQALCLYGFNLDKTIVCHAGKVTYNQKIHSNHQQCNCIPLEIKKKQIKEDQVEKVKIICKNIHKKYSSMINYFDQKIVQLQYQKECANLNSAQFMFLEFLKNMNNCVEESIYRGCYSEESLKQMKMVPGRAIYLAMDYKRKQLENADLEKLRINRIRRIWKGHSEKIFRLFVEGKAMEELFCQMENQRFLNIHSIQKLKYQIDKIILSISQEQQHLFSKNILAKKLVLKNLKSEKNQTKLKEYKGKEVNEVCIYNNIESLAFDKIQIIKELGNLNNLRKLEIKWCNKMPKHFLIEILQRMPYLKYLALLGFSQKFPIDFMKKLYQFKQLASFYIDCNSHPEYYKSYCQDSQFVQLEFFNQNSFPQKEQLLELSKLPKLQNINVFTIYEAKIEQVIKNMKNLKHIALGGFIHRLDIQANLILMKELKNLNSLRTLSLVEIRGDSTKINSIISNNPFLSTIIIKCKFNAQNQARNKIIDDATVECMTNLVQLQTLVIKLNQQITGKYFSKFDSLIMLQIQICNKISKHSMKQALMKMKKLKHLQLSSNNWVDDEVIMSVQSCKQLACLNIQGTNVSGEIVKYLVGLNRLRILNCGDTKISGDNLIELTRHVPSISRLKIENLKVNDKQLLEISANCKALTHLNIKKTQITVEALLNIKQLKVVKCSLNKTQMKMLSKAGIKFY